MVRCLPPDEEKSSTWYSCASTRSDLYWHLYLERCPYSHQNVGILIMSEPTEPFPPQPSPVNNKPGPQPGKRRVPVWAWTLMGLTGLTLVVAVIGISVMVGAASATPAAQTSKNATACKLFE